MCSLSGRCMEWNHTPGSCGFALGRTLAGSFLSWENGGACDVCRPDSAWQIAEAGSKGSLERPGYSLQPRLFHRAMILSV